MSGNYNTPESETLAHSGSGTRDRVKDTVASTMANVADGVDAARTRIAHGTEHFSEEARKRVIDARRAALAAGRSAQNMAGRGRQTAGDFFENQPLVVGALAIAVGAAIGGLLPRSRIEDETLGSRRDDLIEAAERIYHEERRKLQSVTSAVVDEAKGVIDGKVRAVNEVTGDTSLAGAVMDEAKRVGSKLVDKAVEAAEREKLGKPGSSA